MENCEDRLPEPELIDIPKVRTIVPLVSLDEEIQLERELIEQEYRPIKRQWDLFKERVTWDQPLTLRFWEPDDAYQLNQDQIEFIRHPVLVGEIGSLGVSALAMNLCFKSALELFRDKCGNMQPSHMAEIMNSTDHIFYPKDH
jgi:hypothetical protein